MHARRGHEGDGVYAATTQGSSFHLDWSQTATLISVGARQPTAAIVDYAASQYALASFDAADDLRQFLFRSAVLALILRHFADSTSPRPLCPSANPMDASSLQPAGLFSPMVGNVKHFRH